MADTMYIQSVIITPNPADVKAQLKIEVEIYTLFPASGLYPALDLYPGPDLFGLSPDTTLHPGTDLCPAKGEQEI